MMDKLSTMQTKSDTALNELSSFMKGIFIVQGRIIKSLKEGQDVVSSKPHYINEKQVHYHKLGSIPDQIQDLADNFIFDDGRILMPCTLRDETFGKPLRKRTRCRRCRFEAFTIVHQYVDMLHKRIRWYLAGEKRCCSQTPSEAESFR